MTSNVSTVVTRTRRYWTDSYRIIFPDGSQIHYHKLSDQDQKSYINGFPKLYMGNDKYLTRKSYYEVVDHGQNHGIFIIWYLMIRVDASPQGFTVGKEDTDDVPAMLESALGYMNNMCYKGLMKTNSTLSIPKRDAYAFLTNYAKSNHPNFMSNPRSLVKNTPSQKKNKSVEEFQLRFLDQL